VARGGTHSTELLTAHLGYGPLLERDYWALIEDCRRSPVEIMELVARDFPAFAPEDVAVFKPCDEEACAGRPLEVGDVLEVHIRAAGTFRVRVVHRDRQSLTLATVVGHPEAGRITFGAYRNDLGDVIFHIRSRARSRSPLHYVGFVAAGEAMQTLCWTDFVNAVAVTVGSGVIGYIHADKRQIPDEDEAWARRNPTYLARGG
jgi:hypothetical protein